MPESDGVITNSEVSASYILTVKGFCGIIVTFHALKNTLVVEIQRCIDNYID